MISISYLSVKQGNPAKKFFEVTPVKDDLGLTLILKGKDLKMI
jgi:hypothetical protein